jgi:hypothetical protein
VTTPEPARIAESLAFHRELARAGLPFGGFLVNRVLPAYLAEGSAPDPERAAEGDAGLARKLAALHHRFAAVAEAERAEIGRLAQAAPGAPLVEIPLQTEEPTSLQSLARITDAIVA